MGIGFKKLYWIGAGTAFLLILLIGLAVIVPRLVDSAWLKETIQAEASKQVAGDFDFQKAELSILPSPFVSLHQVSLNIPETVQVSLVTIRVYPRLLPLLIGNIELDKIAIDNPDFSLPLPEKSAKKQEEEKPFNLNTFLETVSTKLSPVLAAIPNLDIVLEKGTLHLFSGDAQVFLVTDINGEFKISATGLSATISSFTALHENEKIIAKVENLKGNIQLSEQISAITVDDLSLSYPQVQLSGIFKFDKTTPHARLDITSQKTDITEVREVLPFFINTLYGDLPVVREIFDIIRGGTVSQASLHVEGKSPADLAVFESMLIQAHVKDGEILLSDLGLDLRGVTGDTSIAQGVLEGKNLQAKLGNSTGSGGTLKLGLAQKETTPFHLDLDLNADLADVPPLLKQLVPQKQVLEYLSLIENVEGTGQGRLTMGESLESLTVRVEANKISGQLNYKPIPYPVSIDGGRILYNGLKTESINLQGKIGRSTFTNYSSRMNFEGEPTIEVQSGIFHIVLDEIFPWLASDKRLEDDLKDITTLTGIAEVTVKSIKGPLLQTADLQYELLCDLKKIGHTATYLPGPLNIKAGQATIVSDKITFENLQAELLDSSLTYSGVLQDFISGETTAEIRVTNAEIGPGLTTWFAQKIKTPEEYMFKTPLLVSRADVKWTREELLDLQGDFSIQDGPIFSIDVMLDPDELILRSLALKNGDEAASITLGLKKREISGEFQGVLSKKTIDNILLHNDAFPDAWLNGNIKILINMDSPDKSFAAGKLDGGDFIFPWKPDKPIRLHSFSLSAADKTLTLNSGEAVFEGTKYAMKGQAALTQKLLTLDFDVKADTVELDKIFGVLKNEAEEEKATEERVGKSWDLAVMANINLHADSMLYNNFTWNPFESQITYENNSLDIEVLKAELCNISTPGKLSFQNGQISLDFTMEANQQEFKDILICLEGGEQQMTGILDLKATIRGKGTRDTLVNSLEGNLQYSSKGGYIYQDAHAAKLLSLLNVTDMFQGKISDLKNAGFHYDSLFVEGVMENGVLVIAPAKLEAPIMQIAAEGTIDIPGEKVNLQVLVAPLQTVNKIQDMLPIIRQILPSSIAAVPVEVSGDFSDIKVRTLSMSAISKSAFNFMIDALSTPVRVLEGTP